MKALIPELLRDEREYARALSLSRLSGAGTPVDAGTGNDAGASTDAGFDAS